MSNHRNAPLAAALFAAAALVAPLAAPALASPLRAQTPAAAPAPAAPAAPADTAERLRPGDVVRIQIWREPDLSGEFEVDPAGVVTFPKIGRVEVTEQTPDDLRARLIASYERYLRNPSIEVSFHRRVTVVGAVRNPGVFNIRPTLTLADVFALAGGPTPEGATDRVELLRDGVRVPTPLSSRTRVGDSAIRSGDQLFVPERSWVSRNAAVVAAGLSALASVSVALLLRGRE